MPELTEQEASRKRCSTNIKERCVGSSCMAWRWGKKDSGLRIVQWPAKGDGTEPERPSMIPPEASWFHNNIAGSGWRWVEEPGPRKGYCGVAGGIKENA